MDLERLGTWKKRDGEGLVYSLGSYLSPHSSHRSRVGLFQFSVLLRHTDEVKINFCLEAARAGQCTKFFFNVYPFLRDRDRAQAGIGQRETHTELEAGSRL